MGCFSGTITYSIFKTSIEITVDYPDYADYSNLCVRISSKKLGVDKRVYSARELKAELKIIAEKLTDFIGPEGSSLSDIVSKAKAAMDTCPVCGKSVPYKEQQRYSFAGRCCPECLPKMREKYEQPGWYN